MRQFLVAAVALALAGTAQAQPNVLLIVTDDQRADTLEAMPTVQAELQAKGVTFPASFVVNPTCCPSRIATLTGLYSHSSGFYRQSSKTASIARAFSRVPQLASWLDAAGYETALVGKYLNGYDGSFTPPGWDRWTSFADPVPGYYDYRLISDGAISQYGSAPEENSTRVLAGIAARYVREATAPLFLVYTPFAPHALGGGTAPPMRAFSSPSLGEDVSDKPRWVRRLQGRPGLVRDPVEVFRPAQLNALRVADEGIAQILAALAETGKLADTLIVFTSDNGITWGEHGLSIRKLVPYEESIRVPFVMRWDGRLPAGETASRMVANIDIAPTVLEAAGLPFAGDGTSILTGTRTEMLVELATSKRSAIPTYCGIRTETEKYVAYRDGSQELYDLAADPFELDSIRSKERRYDMRMRLKSLCRPAPPGFRWPRLCTRFGDRRSNVIVGKPWFEVICARKGDDRIDVRGGGRDVVYCGPGRDVVLAGPEDDVQPNCEIVRRY